ncbi:MAG: PTS sugar transporter subunit IIA [Pedosphaera sp.]|nr:PTS sugar transporter subunit IIA [Pedosphaera sp.]
MTGNQAPFHLYTLLSPAAIQLDLAGPTRDDILRELAGAVPEIAGNAEAQAALLQALQERELLHSTGIGDGIALPHARNALVGVIRHPVIVIGRRAAGVPWAAIDDQSAKLFFLLVAPNITQHLAILARVSRLLRDVKLRQSLMTVSTPAKLIESIRVAETGA